MMKHKQKTWMLLLLATLLIVAFVSIIVVNAQEYCSVRVNYVFEDGESAYDSFVAVYERGASVDLNVTNPTINGYKPVEYSDKGEALPAQHTVVTCDQLNDDLTRTVTYVPDYVPYTVSYFKQNIYDDDYTADLTLPDSYYNKQGLTGSFPQELEEVSFEGFTKLYHKPDFIAADGSTQFELYYTRNYYLVNFELDGGHGVEPVYAKYNSPYNIAEPVRKGYSFKGWVLANDNDDFIDEEGNVLTDEQAAAAATHFTNGTVPAHNVNYKAYWEKDKAYYSVVYWVEDADSTNYTDVAALDIYEYADGTDVMTGDTISITDANTVPDFFSYNLNPQKVKKENGNVVLDENLRPIYLTNDAGEPIDEKGNVLDFPEMSPGERAELCGKGRYFAVNTEKSDDSMTVSGDGTTRINVYYSRREITQRFFFGRLTKDGKYEIPGYTKAFSTKDGTLDQHLGDFWGGRTDWMELGTTRPQIADKYKDKLEVKEYFDELNGATYYYYELKTEYYSNMRDNWLEDAFDPYLITNSKSEGEGDCARFGAWSAEWGTPYAVPVNSTVKGIYEKLDGELLFTEEYIAKEGGKYVNNDPLVLNYLSFWANAKNQNWNHKDTFYNFTYQNYVELLPGEYNEMGEWNGKGGYIDVVKVNYHNPDDSAKSGSTKLYGLLEKNIVETFDGGTQYDLESGKGKKYKDRDEAVKVNQTAAALTGFQLLTDEQVAQTDDLKQNPMCDWGAANGFDADHHCNVKYFYRRCYYSLAFMNNNVKLPERTRNIYYQNNINSVGMRGNWIYFEPEYPDADMKDYYIFDGWYFDEEHTKKIPVKENDLTYVGTKNEGKTHFDSDFTMPADDITVFAKWRLVTEHVNFFNDYDAYTGGADPISSCDVEYNGMILTKDVPTTNHEDNRPDLTPPSSDAVFIGWYYINATGTEQRFEPENIPVVKGLDLYAKWSSEESANYRIEYVEKGTNTPVADPMTGIAYVSTTKSFQAKVNNELNEAHQPREGEKSWWPVTSSHSILIKSNEQSNNLYRFEYFKKDKVWYQVRYLDAVTMEPLFEDKEVETADAIVAESYLQKEGYIPDRVTKTLIPAASSESDPELAKEEELAMNTIVFLYTKNDTEALVRIEHFVQKVGGDPDNKLDYEPHRTERFTKELGSTLDMANDVYGSEIAKSMTDSHYIINTNLTEVNDELYDGSEIIIDGSQTVVKVYYMRGNYPYKVNYIDIERENDPSGLLKSTVYSDEADLQPLGAVVTIDPESPLTVDGVKYVPVSDAPQTMTIYHEEFADPDHPDPKVNVKNIYYRKLNSVRLNYEIVCEGAIEGDLHLSQNYEIIMEGDTIEGCTATDYSGVEGRYTFLGWYKSREANEEDFLSYTQPYVPELPLNDTTYYAIFKMNTAPYTINYVYQGRKGGNDSSYTGDDADTDEKIYTVTMELGADQVNADGMPKANILIDNAPAVDDLYKDCVWTINDEYVSFDKATYTVTVNTVQTAKRCLVEFRYLDTVFDVQHVPVNSLVTRDGGFVKAPETDGENPFAYWSVTVNDKEIARCFNREFDLRITADCVVTAYYGATAQAITISDASYSREQTTDESGNVTDRLYADFILAFMEENGELLNPAYDNHTEDEYQTGLIIEYDPSIRLAKEDIPGATLSEEEKVYYPDGDVLSAKDAQKLAQGDTVEGTDHRYICYSVANDMYNNRNRVDRAISFVNSATARHLVLRAYYYVWNQTTGTFEMTGPVYFYLYDIGNSVIAE